MIRTLSRGCLVVCYLAATGLAADRPADEIVAQVDALEVPRNPAESKKADAAKKVELIGELLKGHPADPRLARLLPERWELLLDAEAIDRVTTEVDAVLASTPNPAVRVEAAWFKAELLLEPEDVDLAACRAAVEAFLKLAPKDKRAGMILYLLAYNEPDVARRTAIEDRILKDHTDEQITGLIEGDRRQRSKVGRPFELNFTDAIGGQAVSMGRLRGKVVGRRLLGHLVRPLRRRDAQDEADSRPIQGQGRRVHRHQPRQGGRPPQAQAIRGRERDRLAAALRREAFRERIGRPLGHLGDSHGLRRRSRGETRLGERDPGARGDPGRPARRSGEGGLRRPVRQMTQPARSRAALSSMRV